MNTIRRILCPVDFSDISRHAFDRAVVVAQAGGATLTALHVVPTQRGAVIPYIGPEALAPFPLVEIDTERIGMELRSFLGADSSPMPITCEVREAADPHQAILSHASQMHADVIVMGTHGHSGFHRMILGSTTEKVLRIAPMPVLTVPPPRTSDIAGTREPFRRVLCALDFSACSLQGLEFARVFATQHKAKLGVVHVVEFARVGHDPIVIGPPADLSGLKGAAAVRMRDRLHDIVSPTDRATMNLEEIVVVGKAHHQIVQVAHEWCADLIVLGLHGHSIADRVFFGSTVEPVVRRAECAVVTIRAAPA